MKINKTTIFLIVALLGIWVFIGSLIYNAVTEPEIIAATSKKTKPKKNKDEAKAYELLLNYDSPFKTVASSFAPRKTDSPAPNNLVSNSERPKPAKADLIPQKQVKLQYLGYMQFKSKGKQQLLLKINGQEQLFDKGDNIDGYTIKKINEDSLVLKKGKEIKIVRREY